MYCQHCGAQHEEGAVVCLKCGFAIGTGERHYCSNCGTAVEPGQAVCVACGAALSATASNIGKSNRSKLVAGILGLLLGAYGIHNFYIGKTKRAVIQLVVTLCTCGLGSVPMGIWGLVEGIFFLIGHEGYTTDADGKPLSD